MARVNEKMKLKGRKKKKGVFLNTYTNSLTVTPIIVNRLLMLTH